MAFYTLVLQFYSKKLAKIEDDIFLREKTRRKIKYWYHNDICTRKKDSFFQMKLKLQRELFE